MKKALLLTALVFTVFYANAQVTIKPGIRAGLNLSSYTNTDFDYSTNFYAGGFVAFRLSRFYILQPELNYSKQGADADLVYSPGTPIVKSNISVDYLSFGVINKFTFNDQFDIHVGPTLDFETDGNVNTNTEVDMAVTAGMSYTFPFGVSIEARVKKGFLDVLESDDYNNSDIYVDDWNTNIVFQFGLAYRFDAKGTTK
jgi:hypothetical protein